MNSQLFQVVRVLKIKQQDSRNDLKLWSSEKGVNRGMNSPTDPQALNEVKASFSF